MNEVTGLNGAPSRESAQPNRIAIISTCSTSPVGKRPDEGLGDDPHEKFGGARALHVRGGGQVRTECRGVEGLGVDVHADARLQDIAEDDPVPARWW